MTAHAFYALCLVFIRCSAMLLSSPVFGAQNTPLPIRLLTTLSISGALSAVVQANVGPVPADVVGLIGAALHEGLAGILIGTFMTLAMQAASIAGSMMDMQIGLGMSQSMNPVSGVSSTVLSQFKFMLSVVVFLCANGHHQLIRSLVQSYSAMPLSSFATIQASYIGLLGDVFMIALRIAIPVAATGFVVDAALGLLNRAVPQMQAVQVGIPAKVAMGLMAISVSLPAIVAGTVAMLEAQSRALVPILGR